ncbi:unnamed protein product [Adineta ricciae]|uniref:Uncharacterized protein n=1 Tax=Adineta ricciae TaxID=249248 RepID=A0A815G415_ADIRI|nr:unnamed protein product [Adineta ricciae]CAF1334072.1 unnamed protein product [Adineta ricciae]
MTVCKVFLYGLKPCDIGSSTNDNISDAAYQRQNSLTSMFTTEKSLPAENNFLNIDIKPVLTPMSSRSSTASSDTGHESSPIRVAIRQTPRGRYRICVSQSLLRPRVGDI